MQLTDRIPKKEVYSFKILKTSGSIFTTQETLETPKLRTSVFRENFLNLHIRTL